MLAAAEPEKTVAPDPTEANIARLSARILERSHYLQHPLDDEMSSRFFDRYLETLDGLHLHFFTSDVQEFEKYRKQLDDLTLKKGDTSPGQVIFARLIERIDQRVSYVNELLKSEAFDFTGDERYPVNRKDLPRPKDVVEAKKLWRDHLRYEYLQEKLSVPLLKTNESRMKIEDKRKAGDAGTNGGAKVHKGDRSEIVKTLSTRYSRLLRNYKEFSHDEIFEIYLTALAHAYDPHSDYLGRAQMENFAIQMRLSLFGIGALLRSEDGFCKIEELKPGPALKSKQIKAGDRVVAVAQGTNAPVEVVDMKLQKVVELIRGPKGTEVRLTMIPVDAPDPSTRKVVTLVRDEIKLEDQEAKAKIIETTGGNGKKMRLGVIDLPSFYEDFEVKRGKPHKSTTADVLALLKKLNEERVEGVILDLRRNGGGALNEAINLTGLFIKNGPVVQTKDPDGRINVDFDTDPSIAYDGPLIVLTSRGSASASEILAGALQDYGRALIVGDKSTHGKGTVQSLLQLRDIMVDNNMKTPYDPGALKLTIRKFYRASGSSTQLKGVIPDMILPSINNYAEGGEGSLDNPLPWDEVPSADYEKLNLVQPFVAELKKRSDQRIAREKDFSYLREDITQYQKFLADKSISLNEAQRLKEKHEMEARLEARKAERKARPESEEKIYDITLKNAVLPGLPAPASKTNEVATAETVAPDDTDEFAEDKKTAIDVGLVEARKILADYVTLFGQTLHTKTASK